MIVTPMAAMIAQLDTLRTTYFNGCTFHLYKNNYTPVLGSAAGNFTQSTFTGYGNIVVAAWLAAYDNGANQAEIDTIPSLLTWLCTGGAAEDIYGYYVTFAGLLVYAERDPLAPFNIGPGQTYSVLARFTKENQ